MKRLLTLLALTIPLCAVCCCSPTAGRDRSAPADSAVTRTPQPGQTDTPTPVGTWEMAISGEIYDTATGSPIAGAPIRYEVVHSYFPEIQEGWLQETASDEQGQFSLLMIVHDTDHIRIVVEAQGYITYEEKLDLFGNRNFSIGLTPE